MPMHDWTRVSPNDYHHFHLSWIAALAGRLNRGTLPPGYFAMAEHTVPTAVPDVLTMNLSPPEGPARPESTVATLPLPSTSVTATAEGRSTRGLSRRRVAIHHAEGRRLVAVIEIVSPSNKSRRDEFSDLLDKSVRLLREGVHVQLIDPFPPSARDPRGLHAAVWDRLTGKKFTPPTGKPLTLASYVARGDNTFTAFVEPLAVGDRLPDLPLFLSPDRHVPVPLEATYTAAWEDYPPPLRSRLEAP